VRTPSSDALSPRAGRVQVQPRSVPVSEALALEALARSDEACLVLDRTGAIRYANAAAARVAGVDVLARIGDPVDEVLPQFLATRFAQVCRRALLTDRPISAEAAEPAGDRWFDVRCVPLHDGIALFARDVTGRKRAQRAAALVAEAGSALSSSLALPETLDAVVRLVVPTFADTCFIDLVTPGGTIHRVAAMHRDAELVDALRRLFERVPLEERPDHPVHGVLASGRTLFVRRTTPESITGMPMYGGERQLALALRPTSILIVPLRAGGDVIGAVSFCTTEQRRRFDETDRTLAEDLSVRIAQAVRNARLHEAEGAARREIERMLARLTQVQDATAALSRALPREDVVRAIVEKALPALGASAGGVVELSADGREFMLLHSTGLGDVARRELGRYAVDTPLPTRDVARTHRPVFLESFEKWRDHYPTTLGAGDGAWAVVPLLIEDRLLGALLLGFPRPRRFSDEDREFIATLANQCAQALDRARLYEQAQAARTAAESANEAKSQFLAIMSHELRTPLTAVIGYTELLEAGVGGALGDKQKLYLARIHTSAQHLRDLINEVLTFSRIEARTESLNRGLLGIVAFVRDTVALVRPQAAEQRIPLTLELPEAEAYVLTDSGKLRQILLNLLSNAVKFTDSGDITVRLRVRSGEGFTIDVADTGPGIPLDDQQRIFEPFVQLDPSNTREKGGAGLGLAVSRRLARLLGGDLLVDSEPGRGSVFTLALPGQPPD
jgi:signal transduction histidine kinase